MTTWEERTVLGHLAEAWNLFIAMPQSHPSDKDEFMRAVHAAQNIIASRVAQRADPETWPSYEAEPWDGRQGTPTTPRRHDTRRPLGDGHEPPYK
jgi:hypothetical protein